ncbi:MAG: hypothetical protein MUO85_08740 [candidate division Zixibacteria bacterium]|nr:hypothetical protein [candidate division Zixibacteria bacterium]
MSRKRQSSPIPFFKLQCWMMSDLLEYQKAITHHKDRKARLHKEIKLEESSEEKRKIAKEIQESSIHQLIYKLMIRNLKEIADGMAWRLFNYKRTALDIVGATKQESAIHFSTGLEREIFELTKYCYESRIALLNDLTSIIDVGDITVRNPDGKLEFHEIKGSKSSNLRIQRQDEKQKRAVKFLNDGFYKDGERTYRIENIDIASDNYLNGVLNVLKDAKNKGYSSNVLSKYLIVECSYVDLFNGQYSVERVKEKSRNIRKCWDPKEEVVTLSNIMRLKLYPRLYAPYSIFPFPEDICIDLISGRAMVFSHINISKIIEILQNNNWGVVRETSSVPVLGGPSCSSFLTLTRGDFRMPLVGSEIIRIGFEFMKVNTILDKLEWIFKKSSIDKRDETWFANLSSDKEIWD